jgi:hypothetical protein
MKDHSGTPESTVDAIKGGPMSARDTLITMFQAREDWYYFRVDSRPYLNPHGQCEEEIYILVNELAAELAGLAEREKK